MIRMTDIIKNGDIVSLNCHSDDAFPKEQTYRLSFNAKTREIISKPSNAEMSDISKVMYKLRKRLSSGESLPENDCIVCF